MQRLTPIRTNAPVPCGSPPDSTTQTQMKTILYVEDDEHDVFFLKRAFAQHTDGWCVQNVQSVEEAINYLAGKGRYHDREQFPPVDLIVSDVSIPGGSGYQLLRWVRDHAEFGRIPFVLVTGSAQVAYRGVALPPR